MRRRADGFTLIELLMVVLVVGILASIAIPTYAGQRDAARDSEAFQRLEIALRSGAAAFPVTDAFPVSLPADIAQNEPEVNATATTGFPAGGVGVSVTATTADYRSTSASGRRVAIRDERTPVAGGGFASHVSRWRATTQAMNGGPLVNYLRNPGLEVGALTNWGRTCGADMTCSVWTIAEDSSGPGRYAAEWGGTPNLGGNGAYVVISNGGCPAACVSVSPGDELWVRADYKAASGVCGEFRLTLTRFDAAAVNIGVVTLHVHDTPDSGRWYRLAAPYTVEPGVSFVALRSTCAQIPAATPTRFRLDRGAIYVNPPAANPQPDYVDGDTPGAQWQGGDRTMGRGEGIPLGWL